jgi:glycosyltransferase involved in cell wall biosynthesis
MPPISVRIDPAFDAYYHGYYVEGFSRLFGRHVGIAGRDFPKPGNFLAAIVDGAHVCIDTQDRADPFAEALEWSDAYGKVNYLAEAIPQGQRAKTFPVGPGFGIRRWGIAGTPIAALRHRAAAGRRISGEREFFANYWRQLRYRVRLERYAPATSDPDYLFFVGSLWADDPLCNSRRATFLRVARSLPGVTFEGGFAPRSATRVGGFEELTLARRTTLQEYLAGLRRSAVAFNTAAVFDCLGWKLGEYLALGKAIVSLPLTREMPSPLRHGEHVHYVDGSEGEIREAVERIRRDHDYRRRLESGARRYFEEITAPESCVKRLVAAARKG